ncbi:MAG: ion channel [Candidatus Margulisiibacteriota bacterium]
MSIFRRFSFLFRTRNEAVSTAHLARQKQEGRPVPKIKFGNVVRKGAPTPLHMELYVILLGASWWQVLLLLGLAYLLINAGFALLYLLHPGSITMTVEGSFWEAFFFSVQTMSTIGYGVLAPASFYGNCLVTLESAVGLLGVALVTGLTFAKISRPRAAVVFSKPIVVANYHGKPTLMFRVGNARGSEIIEAVMSVSVLQDELSPEGQHLRRIHDLHLVRSRTPFFLLSWTVMHVIDEKSPLWGIDWEKPDLSFISIAATLVGHDAAYSQTTFARHMYLPEDVEPNRQFVDVIHQLTDGRMMIDYTKFHELV